jgi:hypothetical protein
MAQVVESFPDKHKEGLEFKLQCHQKISKLTKILR